MVDAIIHVMEIVKAIVKAPVAVVMDVAHLIARIHVPVGVLELALVPAQVLITTNNIN